MQIYPQLTAAVLVAEQVQVTFNVIRAVDETVVATGLTASATPGDVAGLISSVRNSLSAWLVTSQFGGDVVAALQAAISTYPLDGWRMWGV